MEKGEDLNFENNSKVRNKIWIIKIFQRLKK